MSQREPLPLPKGAIPATAGIDSLADQRWLSQFPFTDRHYQVYEVHRGPFLFDHDCPDEEVLFGVLLVDGTNIQASAEGTLSPSPSMLGHLDALPGPVETRDPNYPLATYKQSGGTLEAVKLGDDSRYRIFVSTIEADRVRWRDVILLKKH